MSSNILKTLQIAVAVTQKKNRFGRDSRDRKVMLVAMTATDSCSYLQQSERGWPRLRMQTGKTTKEFLNTPRKRTCSGFVCSTLNRYLHVATQTVCTVSRK